MGRILSLMNEKGGVGKSTLTYAVAWELMQQGQKVLIIDMDGQKANISYLAGIHVDNHTLTMQNVMMQGTSIQDAIQSVAKQTNAMTSDNTVLGSISMIPAGINTSYMQPTVKISQMKKIVGSIKNDYDFIFLDVNPSPDWRHALTLSVLDYIAVIMMPDVVSLEANSGIFDSILEVQESFNSNLKVLGFILNQFDGRTNLAKAVVQKSSQMAEYYQTEVFQTTIRKSVLVGESAVSHKGVTGYAPKATVSDDIRLLTKELLQKMESEELANGKI